MAYNFRRYRHDSVHAPHRDEGLQPERTVMSWGRTMMALSVVSALYLRWWPHHGALVLVPMAIAMMSAGIIYLTQRRRYLKQGRGIHREKVSADGVAVLSLTVLVCAMVVSMVVIMLTHAAEPLSTV